MLNLSTKNLHPAMFEEIFKAFDGFLGENHFEKFNLATYPRTDVKESDLEYTFEIELPGFSKENIQINYENEVLSIQAKRTSENEDKKDGGKYIRKERNSEEISRNFTVANIDGKDIKAQYVNGILTLVLPKKKKNNESTKIVIE